jgi:hypothetical protein
LTPRASFSLVINFDDAGTFSMPGSVDPAVVGQYHGGVVFLN